MNLRKILHEIDPQVKGSEQQPKPPTSQVQQKPKPAAKKPAEPPKDKSLEYSGKYYNGGFTDGVKVEPTDGGRIALSISIYGGGEPKKVKIPASGHIKKTLQAYEIGFKTNDSSGPRLEPEIDTYLNELKQKISYKVIDAMKELDMKIKQIIMDTINENK